MYIHILFLLCLLMPIACAQGLIEENTWREALPLECQSPSPSRSHTFPSPLSRQRICSTNQWTPPPVWVERHPPFQKQNWPSKVLLGRTPSKTNRLAWTSKFPCWVSSGEQRAGTSHPSRDQDCTDQKKGLNICLVLRDRGSSLGLVPHSLCDSVKLLGLPFLFYELGINHHDSWD